GRAASQNNWSVLKSNPTEGSFATTTDQTCQTAKDSSSAGIEIHRLRRAIARPVVFQNAGSSGRQSVNTAPASAPTSAAVSIAGISGGAGNRGSASAATPRSIARMETGIQNNAVPTSANSSMKQLVHKPVRSSSAPKAIGSTKPPRPPIMPTRPPTEPTFL